MTRSLGVAIASVVILVFLAIFYSTQQFHGFSSLNAMDSAQVAREIVRGNGMKTKFVSPLAISELEKQDVGKKLDILNMPDLLNPPLYPYYLATVFKVTGAKFETGEKELKEITVRYSPENRVLVVNMLLLIASVLMVYGWARRMFDGRVALLAALLLAFCDNVWAWSISGGSFTLLLFLFTGMGWCVTESLLAMDDEKNGLSIVWYTVAAIFLGLAGLTSYHFVWLGLVLVGLGFIAYPNRLLAGGIGIAVLLLMWTPWFIRNILLVGHPFGISWAYIYHGTGGLPGDMIWRLLDLPESEITIKRFIRVFSLGFTLQIGYIVLLVGSLPLIAFFVASVMHSFKSSRIQAERWFAVACVVILFVANALTFRQHDMTMWVSSNTLIVLAPVLCIFSAAFFYVLLDRLSLPYDILKYLVIAAFCFVNAIPFLWTLTSRSGAPIEFPPYFPNRFMMLKEVTGKQDFICTDLPWATAWYVDRSSLWLPVHIKDFHQIADFKQRVVGILFTPKSRDVKMYSSLEKGEYKEWLPVIMRMPNMPMLYTLIQPLMPEFDYFYLSDSLRPKQAAPDGAGDSPSPTP